MLINKSQEVLAGYYLLSTQKWYLLSNNSLIYIQYFSKTSYGNTCVFIESTSEFLPFLYPSSYNVYTNVDDGSVLVTLPATLQFGGFHYDRAYVSKYKYYT